MKRRTYLQLGLAGLAGGSFLDLLALRNATASDTSKAGAPTKQCNCILIWMDGGPTHFETFDPKPDAPSEIRGDFRPISTNVPGIQICEHMPKLASMADKYAIIRSVCHNQGNHGAGNHYMMTGAPPRIPVGCGAFVSFHPSLGSVAAYERSAPHGLPAYFTMPSMSRSGGPNFLGAKYAPFIVGNDPNSKNFRVRDVELPGGLAEDRFAARRDLRKLVDRMPRFEVGAAIDPVSSYDDNYEQGYELVQTPEAQKAFDVDSEPDVLREAYGRNAFGQRALLARRLVEAGVPFVTIYDGGWDHHSDLFGALEKRLPSWDQTVATLINDLDQRGLLENTMVIALGEFGRTPKISTLAGQTKPGRDHWANAMSILFAGGGARGGQVIGATDRQGYAPIERVLSPENYVSTVYHKLGIDPNKIYYTPAGRPTHLVSDSTPIAELM
ncbi:hypothetical protein VN12_20390 [Pirellula sp. SH-Sr6A]|uniref:DUF1501 domain-containing protein n=1 Tax=Pirellula sp. SH-Sr6A TaxID=1632865 RepID=UPI00078EA326|nr:DUF1501 domain-containing protein [Pirellula sp. SH-Sr6A]AMV34496.1 hypothetical protein VN12_20390 [Pirellula sp. SH-Sr6A]